MFSTLVEMFISFFTNRNEPGHFVFMFIVSFFHQKKVGKRICLLSVFILTADDMTGHCQKCAIKNR